LKFEVTPVASAGTSPGIAVASDGLAIVAVVVVPAPVVNHISGGYLPGRGPRAIVPVVPTITPQSFILSRILKLNMKGDDVRALQVYLNTHGYVVVATGAGSIGYETNIFGKLTKLAIMKFQKDHGLKVDGIVGPKTLGLMK